MKKYHDFSYKGTMEALSAPGKLAQIKSGYESADNANRAIHDERVTKRKQMIELAVEVYGETSNEVKYLRDKPVPNPPDLMAAYRKLEKKFNDWVKQVEALRQAERQRQIKAERESQRRAERAEKKRIQAEERERREAQRQAEQREKAEDYRRRSQAARTALESCDYKYGVEFRDNAITFAKKHIEEIRPGVWQRRIERMEDLEPAWD